MYSLCQNGLQNNRHRIHPIDAVTYLITSENGSIHLYYKGRKTYSKYFEQLEQCIPYIKDKPFKKLRANLDDLVLDMQGFCFDTGTLSNVICLPKKDIATAHYGISLPEAGFESMVGDKHSHAAPAAGILGEALILSESHDVNNRYDIYRQAPGLNTLVQRGTQNIQHGESTPSLYSGLIPCENSEVNLFIKAYDITPNDFKLVAYKIHSRYGWLRKYVLLNNVGLPWSGVGLNMAFDRTKDQPKLVIFIGGGNTGYASKVIYGDTQVFDGGEEVITESIPVRIVRNTIFNNPTTCVTTCPGTGKIVIYDAKRGAFYTYSESGFKALKFSELIKLKEAVSKLSNIYKELLKQRGIISPGKKEIIFDTCVTKPAQVFLKEELGSPAFDDKLEIVISAKDKEGKEISVKLVSKSKKINHEFKVPVELWEKAFIYREKRSTLSEQAPVLKFLRMIKGSEHIPERILTGISSMDKIIEGGYSPKSYTPAAYKKKKKRKKKKAAPIY